MPQSGYQVLSSDREEEVHFQFTPNVARSKSWSVHDKNTFKCYFNKIIKIITWSRKNTNNNALLYL